jgi:hypothetical protein
MPTVIIRLSPAFVFTAVSTTSQKEARHVIHAKAGASSMALALSSMIVGTKNFSPLPAVVTTIREFKRFMKASGLI